MKVLPTKVHGVLDYLVGLALVLAPYIFMFHHLGGAAVYVPQILGLLLIIYSLFTDYEWGVFRRLSMKYHLVIDFIAALFLAVSPFIFGFEHHSWNVWLPHVVVGIVVILVVLVSQSVPGPNKSDS